MGRTGEAIFSVITVLAAIAGLTLIGLKYFHTDEPPVTKSHTEICDKKPDCKCDELEAKKVTVKP